MILLWHGQETVPQRGIDSRLVIDNALRQRLSQFLQPRVRHVGGEKVQGLQALQPGQLLQPCVRYLVL